MSNNNKILKLGVDIGSTTAKLAVLDSENNLLFSEYRRHNTQIYDTTVEMMRVAKSKFGNFKATISITGSAGMGMSENAKLPFIQEVIAATEVVKQKYPEVKTMIDIGGEDSKMIFFYDEKAPDIRMNGSCAGGTGAFIDQTASLLNVPLEEFNDYSTRSTQLYPIASRCGVFAKTDIQNLLSRKILKEDIIASVFHSVAVQVMNTLSRGTDIAAKIMFTGGPFTFMPELTKSFVKNLKVTEDDIVLSENPAIMPAIGAALNKDDKFEAVEVDILMEKIMASSQSSEIASERLKPLFNSNIEFKQWSEEKVHTEVPKMSLSDYEGNAYLGLDSGSTTTKIALITEDSRLLFNYYSNNKGNAIETVKDGFKKLHTELKESGKIDKIKIVRSAITGYGEDLLRAAFGVDIGIVETIAHYEAAKYFNKDVSFIMDIGGQDMKAIFIKNGAVERIKLNESCSAGCGSFIETFGKSLGHDVQEFSELACSATAPCDLGTRCTVFMNSKVKQALRENATVNDIAAGLSVSVIKNALYKVLKVKDIQALGDVVAVQGGTFRNPSVQKALEDHIGQKVICTDIPEQMGAYGAARVALAEYKNLDESERETSFMGVENVEKLKDFETKHIVCKGCENLCTVSRFKFKGDRKYYSGNKCEKIFSNKGFQQERGVNLFDEKIEMLFNREMKAKATKKKPKVSNVGIPRVLNMFDNFPFWNTLFTECGINVVLSDPSTMPLYEKGKGTIMSDSICFPAKVVHGHIYNLIDKEVERIFYPTIIYEINDHENSENSFNCPIVSSYSEVISSSINPERKYNISVDSPVFNLDDKELLEKAAWEYFKTLGVSKNDYKIAFERSVEEEKKTKKRLFKRGQEVIKKAIEKNSTLIVLAGRPYHVDPLIHQKTPDMIADSGVDVIPEDVIPQPKEQKITDLQIISQWSYPNRIYQAAQWVAEQEENIQFVQMNSFGCGPDSIVIDECIEILKAAGKNHTLIRVDDITSTGSVRLRLRSMLETLRIRDKNYKAVKTKRITTAVFEEKDKRRTIVAPFFADMYSGFIPVLFESIGYKLVNLPKPTKQSVQYGLRYSNNEICYPATVVVGDVIKFLQEGDYDRNDIAVAITQTGGQCRASTYLSLIKKGMIDAGFEDIPVISVGTAGKTLNPQPGFDIDWKKLLPVTFVSMLYADSLAKMYYSTIVREKNKGESKNLIETYLDNVYPLVLKHDTKSMYKLLKQAVIDFNNIEIIEGEYPKIGLVGEIYIKYNSFGHQFIVDWMIEQGVEVIVPPILDFFIQEFVNIRVNQKNKLVKAEISKMSLFFLEHLAGRHIRRANRILKGFRFYDPFHKIHHSAKEASKIVNLANQFGEGWLIPAEISAFANGGVNNVVSVQPFGCIANHVISKGVEKRMKEQFPKLNLLFLDFDDGTSEVNVLNRLHFMVKNVKEHD